MIAVPVRFWEIKHYNTKFYNIDNQLLFKSLKKYDSLLIILLCHTDIDFKSIINCDVLTKEQNKNNKGIYIKKANQGELEYNENRIIVFGIILYLILDAQGVDLKGLFEILN